MSNANETLYTDFADLAALNQQKEKVLSIFDEVKAGIRELSALGLKLDGAKSISDLKTALGQVTTAQDKLKTAQSDAAKEAAKYNVQLQEQNKANKEAAREALGLNDAYKKLEKQYNDSQRAAKNIGVTAGENSDQFKAAASEAKRLSDQLKSIDNAVGQNQRNVGNYKESFSVLEKELSAVTEKLEKAKTSVQNFNREQVGFKLKGNDTSGTSASFGGGSGDMGFKVGAENAAKEVQDLTRQQQALQQVVGQNAKGFTSLTQELRQSEKALQSLRNAGLAETESFKALQEQTNQTRKEFNDFAKEQKILSSDIPALTSLTVAAKGLAGAYAVGAGAAALFGDEEGKIEKEVQKLVAIMTVLQGLQEAHELLEQKGAIATALHTAAQKTFAFVVGESTGALKALRIGLALTGAGLAILGIGYLISNFKELKESFFGVNEEAKKNAEILKEAGSKYTEVVKQVGELKLNIDLAKKGFLDKDKVVKEYNESIGKTTGEVKTLDEAEQALTKNGDAYIEMTLKKAVANIALGKAAESAFAAEEKRRKKAEEFLTVGDKLTEFGARNSGATPGGFVPGLQEQATATAIAFNKAQSEKRKKEAIKESEDEQKTYTDIATEAQTAAAKIAKAFNFNFFDTKDGSKESSKSFADDIRKEFEDARKSALEAGKARLEDQIGFNKDIAADDSQTFEVRLSALKNFIKDSAALTQKENDFEISEIKRAAGERIKAVKAESDKRAAAVGGNKDEVARIRNEESQYISAIVKAENAKIEKLEQDKQIALQELGRSGGKQFNDIVRKSGSEQVELIKTYETDSLNAVIDRIKAEYKLRESAAKDFKKMISDGAADFSKITDTDTDDKRSEAIKNLSSGLEDLNFSLIEDSYERQKNQLQEQIDLIDEKRSKEQAYIDQTIHDEQKRAAATIALNAKSDAQKQQLELRQRQIDQQKARVQKAASITQIIQSTAEAVIAALGSKPYTPANIGIAALVGALGAAQLARVIAQPIPQYFTGTQSAKKGVALVSEKGQELVETRSGQFYLTPKEPSLMDLAGGEKITPADVTKKMLSGIEGDKSRIFGGVLFKGTDNKELLARQDEQISLLKEIRNKPGMSLSIYNDALFTAYIEKAIR